MKIATLMQWKAAIKSIEIHQWRLSPTGAFDNQKLYNTNKFKLLESYHCKKLKSFELCAAQCSVLIQKSRMTIIDGKPYLESKNVFQRLRINSASIKNFFQELLIDCQVINESFQRNIALAVAVPSMGPRPVLHRTACYPGRACSGRSCSSTKMSTRNWKDRERHRSCTGSCRSADLYPRHL